MKTGKCNFYIYLLESTNICQPHAVIILISQEAGTKYTAHKVFFRQANTFRNHLEETPLFTGKRSSGGFAHLPKVTIDPCRSRTGSLLTPEPLLPIIIYNLRTNFFFCSNASSDSLEQLLVLGQEPAYTGFHQHLLLKPDASVPFTVRVADEYEQEVN